MASPKKLNLTSLYSQCVHVPNMSNTENKSPLYARTSYDNDIESSSLTRDESWMKVSATTYNSPTNVRRIALGAKKVLIGFWKPYIKGGKPSTEGNWRLRDIPGESPYDIAIKQLQFESAAVSGVDMAYLSGMAPQSVLSGYPLKCITTPWVLSNLEEIYIDPKLLISQDIGSRLGINLVAEAMRGNISSTLTEKLTGDILCMLSGKTSTEELLKQLPRLRVFGIIYNLDENIQGCSTHIEEGKLLIQNFKQMSRQGFSVYRTPLFNKLNLEALTTRNMYIFDEKVLSPYAESLHSKLLEDARAKRDEQLRKEGKLVENQANIKGEVEEYLDKLWETRGPQYCLTVLQLTFARATQEDKRQEFTRLTEAGKARYSSVLG